MSSRDWALTVFVACVIAAIALFFKASIALTLFIFLAILALAWAIFDPWLKRHLPFSPKQPASPDLKADADLRRRCRQLGQQIAFFAAGRRATDPSRVPHWHGLAPDADMNEAFNRRGQQSMDYSTETQNQYNVQFMGPALAVFDELLARGWIADSERRTFELPTNQLGIEEIARTFQRIGEA
jgi:hypothetical protein